MELDALLHSPLLASIVTGLIAWGGVSVQLKWLRRDVDDSRRSREGDIARIQQLELAVSRLEGLAAVPGGRRAYDPHAAA